MVIKIAQFHIRRFLQVLMDLTTVGSDSYGPR